MMRPRSRGEGAGTACVLDGVECPGLQEAVVMRRQKKSAKADPGVTAGLRARRCGLCGKTKGLVRTECCGNWICDDGASYRLFSYARNSCWRNHSRYTLCGFHSNEGHDGTWQDCASCRDAFETEMYVYFGTNEYNFTKLPNPPDYEPTLCKGCGRRIVLGEGGYTQFGGEYSCMTCFSAERARVSRGRDGGEGP